MKSTPTGPCTPPENLKGVQVVFEDGDGTLRCFWLDLKKVQGISWCDQDPPNRGKPPKGKKPAQGQPPDGLEDCQPLTPGGSKEAPVRPLDGGGAFEDPPLCWWNGSRWECGEF